ncbi:MAG: hypothetical protein U9M90_03480 [Patescibacteria group bacterium]|nr:hypothetical protein [Patescibacteria group bacterium]
MNNPKDVIRINVQNSSLTDEQKETWSGFLENIDDELAAPIAETIENDANMLELLTKNIEDKIQALSSKKNEAWDNVIQEEERTLKDIDK